jgi:hypothetical protein
LRTHAFTVADPASPTATPAPLTIARPPVHPRDFRASSGNIWLAHSQARPLERPVEPTPVIRSLQDLVVQLCRMPVDLAAPLIGGSLSSLDTPALLALIAATGEPHHLLVARRNDLNGQVIKALIRSNSDAVWLALAQNHGLVFDADDQAVLTRLSHDRPALRALLLRHPSLARANRRTIAGYGLSDDNLKLVRILRAGHPNLFILECARRMECEATYLQRAVTGPSAAPLALLCCALGLDRAVFLNLLPHWQSAYPGDADCNTAHKPLILSIFDLSPSEARRKLLMSSPPARCFP